MPKRINLKAIKKKAKKAKATTPRLIAVSAVGHFKNSFRVGGFVDDRLDPWKKRKYPDKNKKRRAILVDSGDLRRSIKAKRVNPRSIVVGSYGTAYASRHNRGLHGMPKRQFIGTSHKLNMDIRLIIFKRYKQTLK